MDKYNDLSKENLIDKIRELEDLIDALKEEKNQEELLIFPWVGNLGHWYWDVKSNNVICNDQKILALKYRKDEIPRKIGFQFFTEKLHPEDYERVMENMRRHLYGHTPVYEVVYRIQAKDGSWKWYYDRGKVTKRNEDGKPLLVAGIVFDITVEKEMQLLIEEKNKELLEIVNIDYLTKVFNRKALYEKLKYEVVRVMRNNECLSVLMLDIDHFKAINDMHGHLVGDVVLKQVAQIIKKSVREVDIVGRYGGEEFLVIFPKSNSKQCFTIAERIRKSIQESEFPDGIVVTLSGGLKEYNQESIDKLIDEADKSLYQAKYKGRNQIVF
ncbi:sensor domain-containing diguanylate cyclase [Desulfosporosinus sp. Sb-LF]|uniref:GGDEF domain-containing protein n=1 Tax=Desulfosporosinus sp. Sb-LF TaxID=2560027 RepID=UPI00107F3299|nr:sensor domain-containing diguanylate cyclase [Desulfosporosinus sp. Sb-LF]TGE32028.1 sensor domain-containing diguanylate cyclase [Desulfosporosinus sp. Sb-LF]